MAGAWPRRLWRWSIGLAVAALIAIAALMLLWQIMAPVSTLMLARTLTGRPVERQWMPIEAISPLLVRSVIASEDARFCIHDGIDWQSLAEVLDTDGGPRRGASTITMQTAKNLFLWHGRSYIRKALELPLALMLDLVWSKRRILEVYLNIAEWGDGVFGAEAGARRAFARPSRDLTPQQAALLATALPNPILRNPAQARRGHKRLAAIIEMRVRKTPDADACLDL